MPDLFKHLVNSILQYNRDYFENPLEGETVEATEKVYVPYVVNKALSFHVDCILQANEMNMYPSLSKKMQFQYLLNNIRKWKRPFQKWEKYEKPEDLDMLKEYYQFSNDKAKEALKLLTPEQKNTITKRLERGGIEKNVRPKHPSAGNTKRPSKLS